jgi:hypothetical protein
MTNETGWMILDKMSDAPHSVIDTNLTSAIRRRLAEVNDRASQDPILLMRDLLDVIAFSASANGVVRVAIECFVETRPPESKAEADDRHKDYSFNDRVFA